MLSTVQNIQETCSFSLDLGRVTFYHEFFHANFQGDRMLAPAFLNLLWAVLFCVLGSLVGGSMIFMTCLFLPKILDKLTPTIDEEKEIARGNVAVAEYFGRVVSAGIIGISLVVAAAVLGGLIAALHG